MGQHVWLLLATISTELLAIVKWSKGQFPVPLPTLVRYAWLVGATLLVLYPVGQVSGHVTTFFYGRFLRVPDIGSCSTCSLAFLALADICAAIRANQGSRLSSRLLWGLLNISNFLMCDGLSPTYGIRSILVQVLYPALGASCDNLISG